MAEYIFEIKDALYNPETGEAVLKPEYISKLVRCQDCKESKKHVNSALFCTFLGRYVLDDFSALEGKKMKKTKLDRTGAVSWFLALICETLILIFVLVILSGGSI